MTNEDDIKAALAQPAIELTHSTGNVQKKKKERGKIALSTNRTMAED